MVIYDEWLQCERFLYESPARLPGLVTLKHVWA
jgi:hypothetical protein